MLKRMLFIAVFLVAIAAVATSVPATSSAVDILNTCSNSPGGTAAQKAACADCGGAASTTGYCQEATAQNDPNNPTPNPIIGFIKTIINVVSYVAGAAAVIILIASGLRLVLTNGDSNTVSTARNGILYSLAGIAVIALAQVIVIFVLDRIK